jgi:hypothetical protein
MQKIEVYRNHAEECRSMASRSRLPGEREMLLNMARTWDDLATFRAEQIAQQNRIDAGRDLDAKAAPATIPIDQLNASNDE